MRREWYAHRTLPQLLNDALTLISPHQAFSSFAVSIGGLLNQFAWPVSLKVRSRPLSTSRKVSHLPSFQHIGWKTYIIFAVWDFFQGATIYFLAPETKGRTLEELDDIFAAKNPKKASLEKKKIALDASANVVDVQKV